MIDRLFDGVKYALLGGLFVLSYLWPRDESLWVFGAKGGTAFVDNSKYLYLYTAAEREHIRPVWLSKNETVINELQAAGYEAYHTDSLRGILFNLRAGFVFVSDGMADTNRWCFGGATVVNLWHGVGLKKVGCSIGRSIIGTELPFAELLDRLLYRIFKRSDWFVVTSDAMISPFASGRRQSPDRIITTGYPRNDFLDGSMPEVDVGTDHPIYEQCRRLHEENTVFIYTPTYHRETNQRLDDHIRWAELDRWLAEHDAYLVVKPHPHEPFDVDEAAFSRIIPMAPELDVYPLLKETDALITDYSSIYFDYLLLDKPVVFYPFDLEEYRAERGFYLDYERVTPGPMATDFDGLLECIEQVVEDDTFADERWAVQSKYLQQSVGSRCGTICDRFDVETPQKAEANSIRERDGRS